VLITLPHCNTLRAARRIAASANSIPSNGMARPLHLADPGAEGWRRGAPSRSRPSAAPSGPAQPPPSPQRTNLATSVRRGSFLVRHRGDERARPSGQHRHDIDSTITAKPRPATVRPLRWPIRVEERPPYLALLYGFSASIRPIAPHIACRLPYWHPIHQGGRGGSCKRIKGHRSFADQLRCRSSGGRRARKQDTARHHRSARDRGESEREGREDEYRATMEVTFILDD
jgi:hypothetical protein